MMKCTTVVITTLLCSPNSRGKSIKDGMVLRDQYLAGSYLITLTMIDHLIVELKLDTS